MLENKTYNLVGIQIGCIKNDATKILGAQIGMFLLGNVAYTNLVGIQLGAFVNKVKNMTGLQLGIINIANNAKGF